MAKLMCPCEAGGAKAMPLTWVALWEQVLEQSSSQVDVQGWANREGRGHSAAVHQRGRWHQQPYRHAVHVVRDRVRPCTPRQAALWEGELASDTMMALAIS